VKHPVKKMLLIMFLTLPLLLTFGSYGLYSWSLTLDGDGGFYLFYNPLSRLYRLSDGWGLTRFVEEGRIRFTHLRTLPIHGGDNPLNRGQEEPVPGEMPLPAEPEPAEPLFSGETLDILVIGDSLANSVGKRLGPLINAYPDMTCRVEGVISSNLIRLDYYDWLKAGPSFVREDSPDLVLIFLGANTMQSFYLDGTHAPLFSQKWLEIYRERASELLESLKSEGVDVYWMNLPPMQKESYNKNIGTLDRLIDDICREEGVERLSYCGIITDGEGKYVSEKVVGDRQLLLRSDGIHFTLDGAEYISTYLIGVLRQRYGLPERDPTPRETPPGE